MSQRSASLVLCSLLVLGGPFVACDKASPPASPEPSPTASESAPKSSPDQACTQDAVDQAKAWLPQWMSWTERMSSNIPPSVTLPKLKHPSAAQESVNLLYLSAKGGYLNRRDGEPLAGPELKARLDKMVQSAKRQAMLLGGQDHNTSIGIGIDRDMATSALTETLSMMPADTSPRLFVLAMDPSNPPESLQPLAKQMHAQMKHIDELPTSEERREAVIEESAKLIKSCPKLKPWTLAMEKNTSEQANRQAMEAKYLDTLLTCQCPVPIPKAIGMLSRTPVRKLGEYQRVTYLPLQNKPAHPVEKVDPKAPWHTTLNRLLEKPVCLSFETSSQFLCSQAKK